MMSTYFWICVLHLSVSVPIEDKPLCADSQVNGHANPTFLLKKQDSSHLVRKLFINQRVL